MAKWYVEYRAYNRGEYMGGIEAEDGKAAIQYVKDHVIGVNRFHNVQRDDDSEQGGVYRGVFCRY